MGTYLARQNELRFSRIINTKNIIFSSFLAAVFCPKNLAFAQKEWFCPILGA